MPVSFERVAGWTAIAVALGGIAYSLSFVIFLNNEGGRLPRDLGLLGVLSGALLLVVYVGRPTVFNPKNPFLLTVAVASGFVVNPAWFAWLGLAMLGRGPHALRAVERG
jgi:hypothetical protein